jgi:RNA-binding protein YhbY
MNSNDYKKMFQDVLLDKPHCILGKKGINHNEGFIKHVQDLLKKHKIIKIKLLKTALHGESVEQIAQTIADSTDSYLLDLRGRTVIISKYPVNIH